MKDRSGRSVADSWAGRAGADRRIEQAADRRIGAGRAAGSFAPAIESGTVGGATIARRGGVTYGRGFFDLQIEFAEAVSALSGIPLARAVLDYTNFYIRFGLGRDFDPTHAIWRQYVAGLEEAANRGEWSHRFYEARDTGMAAPGTVATFGCFSYAWLPDDRIRLHFHNAEMDGQSPLARGRRDRRVSELTAIFTHVKR